MSKEDAVAVNEDAKNHFLDMTPGKLLGLRRVTDASGRFKVLACDQNNSFRRMIAAARGRDPQPNELVEAKMDITEVLGEAASAVLLDVNYGARQALNSGALPRSAALMIRLEASKPAGSPAEVEPGWGVEQIKRFGADAVKLLVYLDTEDKPATDSQLDFIRGIHKQCEAHDILLLIEELSFPRKADNEEKETPSYLHRQPGNVLQAVKLLGPLCDVLKVEFPGHLPSMGDERCRRNLERLNDAAIRPWVLLSAGVDFDDFVPQVKLAMAGGASGIMAGRAVFKEYFLPDTRQERIEFLKNEAIDRWKRLCDTVDKHALPWQRRLGITDEDLAKRVAPHWYQHRSSLPVSSGDQREPVSTEGAGDY